jgi:hypothetical protein
MVFSFASANAFFPLVFVANEAGRTFVARTNTQKWLAVCCNRFARYAAF